MVAKSLSAEEIAALEIELPDWSVVNGKLHRGLLFTSFVEAFGFLTQVALIAESMGHHPELGNIYNRVVIDLTTHDTGGLSSLDLELARRIDGLLND
ncbi:MULTISPECIES: 4a-hydroxytetrahydrobiopterin dehydratase [unclassified Synechococcus]|uniref:4a-hydroxytetrahydrobiopterin dehydratase n=1 Tax=unclassified Synechococcus TaxID=2626047 RepID=UPI0021A7613F|nr:MULTISPECIES: 4a-hydroxytetrahydrobiopterin dehydratase [unclassified Synechococcus]MCT0212985.1 4a-hydroxytetrahydrobiopterin dehydratase [Synechococcus sp. CS-1326]MCT0232229.1 4a-hydroxytetrahydrobiopterin dehydratase [Synechococcus sp. CS-1327]